MEIQKHNCALSCVYWKHERSDTFIGFYFYMGQVKIKVIMRFETPAKQAQIMGLDIISFDFLSTYPVQAYIFITHAHTRRGKSADMFCG